MMAALASGMPCCIVRSRAASIPARRFPSARLGILTDASLSPDRSDIANCWFLGGSCRVSLIVSAREDWMGQPGFLDLDERYQRLSETGDPLVTLSALIASETVRPRLLSPGQAAGIHAPHPTATPPARTGNRGVQAGSKSIATAAIQIGHVAQSAVMSARPLSPRRSMQGTAFPGT